MKIKVLVDHVGREIGFVSELKSVLERSGAIVDVEHQDYQISNRRYDFFTKVFGHSYDVVLTPSYNTSRTPDLLLRTVFGKSKLVIYHSEQLIKEYIELEKLNLQDTARYNRHVCAHFVWGRNFSRRLQQKSKVDKRRIFLVGNYKFEKTKSDTSPWPEKKLDRTKVLVVSDYKPADYTEADLLKFKKLYKAEFDRERVAICKRAKSEMFDFVESRFGGNDGYEVVLRPHPGELQDDYYSLASKFTNVQVADITQPISGNIDKCDFGIGFTSSSCLEFRLACVPFISVDFFDFDRSKLGPHSIFLTWKSPSEALRIIEDAKGTSVDSLSYGIDAQEQFEDYFELPESPVNVCAASLLKVARCDSFEKPKLDLVDFFTLTRRFLLGSIKVAAINIINRSILSKFLSALASKVEDSEKNKLKKGEVLPENFETKRDIAVDDISLKLGDFGWKSD